MRLPKRLVSVPLQPILCRLRDIARKAARHQILLVRQTSLHLRVNVIQSRRTSQIIAAVGAAVIPVVEDCLPKP